MAEKPETPQILDELSKSNAAKSTTRVSRQRKAARRRIGIVLVLLLPLITAVFFLAYQQYDLQYQIALTEDTLKAQAIRLQSVAFSQSEVPEAIPFDDSALRDLEVLITQNRQQLDQRISQLQNEVKRSESPDQQWKILEAEYLLSIANQRLLLESDLESAISLLESADNSLLSSSSNTVFAVRQSIAADLSRLRNLSLPDREGIYLRIENLVSQMGSIDLLSSMRDNFENRRSNQSQPVQTAVDSSGWFQSSLDFLGTVFIWRKWEDVPDAMLAPGQGALIKQNMQLTLAQAQLALLMSDGTLFQASLNKSKSWLQQYAVTHSGLGNSMLEELEQLLTIDIDPDLPGLDQTLNLIAALSASAENQIPR